SALEKTPLVMTSNITNTQNDDIFTNLNEQHIDKNSSDNEKSNCWAPPDEMENLATTLYK
ncbi:2213_t:CDS:1, partial [Acaulospora morrowiae]